MRSPLLASALVAACVVLPSLACADTEQLLVDPPFSLITLSPSGRYVAAHEKSGYGIRSVLVYNTETKETDHRFQIDDRKSGRVATITDLVWVDDQHLAVLAVGREGGQGLYLFQNETGVTTQIEIGGVRKLITTPNGGSSFYVIERTKPDPDPLTRILRYDARQLGAAPTEIYRCKSHILDGVLDSEGNLRILLRKTEEETAWFTFNVMELSETRLTAIDSMATVHGIDSASKRAIVSIHQGVDVPAIYSFDIEKDRIQQELASDPLYSVPALSSPVFDPANGRLVGLHLDTIMRRSVWSDTEMEKIQARVDEKLPGTSNRIISWSNSRSKILVRCHTPSFPVAYYLVNLDGDELIPIYLNGAIPKPAHVGQTQLITISSRSGAPLSLSLITPPGNVSKKLPLVVWLSRGMWNNLERPEWNAEASFFAAEGFAAARINYSGIHGMLGPLSADRQSVSAIQQIFDDIEDCVDALIQAEIVDPNRICIAGEGDGAWAAAYAPIATPNKYRVVVSINGVYDLIALRENTMSFIEIVGNTTNSGLRYDHQSGLFIADKRSRLTTQELIALSPIKNTTNYPSSVFVTLGSRSNDHYKTQTTQFAKALRKVGVKVVLYSDDWSVSFLHWKERAKTFAKASKFMKSAID